MTIMACSNNSKKNNILHELFWCHPSPREGLRHGVVVNEPMRYVEETILSQTTQPTKCWCHFIHYKIQYPAETS